MNIYMFFNQRFESVIWLEICSGRENNDAYYKYTYTKSLI